MSSLRSTYQSLVDFLLAPKLATPFKIDQFRAELAVKLLTALFVWSLGAACAVGFWAGSTSLAWWTAGGALICAATALAMRLTDKLAWLGAACGAGLAGLWTGIAWVSGGLGGFTASWLVAAIFVGLIFGGRKLGAAMTALAATLWVGLHVGASPDEAWAGAAQAARLQLVEVGALGFGLLTAGLLRQHFIEWLIIKLRQVAAEANAFVETAPVGLVSFDLDGQLFRSNRATAEIFGYSDDSDRLMGTQIDELLEGIDLRSFGREAEKVSEGRRDRQELDSNRPAPTNLQVTATRADGTTFLAEVAGAKLPEDRGVLLSVRDITEREAYQEQLRNARDEALEASRAKSAFLANMSHELRTPLNAVIGYSEMLIEEANLTQDQSTSDQPTADQPTGAASLVDFLPDLQRIRTAGKHQLTLIDDVLDLSKIEAGKMDMHLETVDLGELVDDVAQTVRPLAQKNDNALEVHLDDAVGQMHTDLTKLRQVLFNLLSNACKFTKEGSVSLSVRRAGDAVEFTVSDDGIGMSDEQLERVFDAFTQADQSTTRRFGGTGLGLTIAQHFCHKLGGAISVQSALGEGTDFCVRLPLVVHERAHEHDTQPDDDKRDNQRDDDLPVAQAPSPPVEA